jgi:hypothetical protein
MLNFGNIEKFLKALDSATATDETRAQINAIHVLSSFTDKENNEVSRLVACDGRILVIADVKWEILNWACQHMILAQRESSDGEICYLTPKKTHFNTSSLFPYPDVMRLIVGKSLVPATKNSEKAYRFTDIERVLKIREAYTDSKRGTFKHFTPNYVPSTNLPTSCEFHISEGLLLLVMPVHTQFTAQELYKPTLQINEYLPGFFSDEINQEQQQPETILSE